MKNFWSEISKPIIGLAPMDGVTDEPMRQIQCAIAKPDVMYTEFIQVEGYARKPKIFKDKLTFRDTERPIVAQVVGCTPDDFYTTVSLVAEMGFDGIDLNMGCPQKDVVQRGAGGALIGNYKLVEEIIAASLKAINGKLPLSVKTRIGKSEPITKQWFTYLSQFPLAEVTIHGRLLNQVHSGPVDWEAISEASKILKNKGIICLGNGGVKSKAEAKSLSLRYGLDGTLIGQAALGNPWVFKEDYGAPDDSRERNPSVVPTDSGTKGGKPTKQEILDTILKHGQLSWDFHGPKKYATVLKHYSWYPREFPNSKDLRIKLLKTKSYEEVKLVIAEETY